MLIPFLFFLHLFMRDVPDPAYHTIDVPHALKRAWGDKNLRGAFASVFLLECFYATMVIYFPIYISNLGVPLITYLTAIIPIALTPFVIMPYELGIIADKKLGEKEMLVTGLLVTATSVLLISVLNTTSTLVWILVLLMSRIGAACVETMAYTYFYKKINPEDSSLMAAFTNMRSTAIIVVTILSTILGPIVLYYPSVLFILLALALLYGVTYVIPIKDTR
jgi:Major Facilitator Superfamily.